MDLTTIITILSIATLAIGIPVAVTTILKNMMEAKKLNLAEAPRLWLNGASMRYNGELSIDLNNKGERAILEEFIALSGNIILHSKSLPFDLEKDQMRYIYAQTNGIEPIHETKYRIAVLYRDSLNNKYKLIIDGIGSRVEVSSDKMKWTMF